jgi:nucleotide-binding universal stress UspA family protein
MYRRILVAVENSRADKTILAHVSELARLTGAELLLVHVADGWAARNFDQLKLRESEEMRADRAYLEEVRADLVTRGYKVETRLAMGDPATELVKASEELGVDLIAMSTGSPTAPSISSWTFGISAIRRRSRGNCSASAG